MDMPVYKATEQDAAVYYRDLIANTHRYAFDRMQYHKGKQLDREYITIPIIDRETEAQEAHVKIDVQLLEAGVVYHETDRDLSVCLTSQQMVIIGQEVERGRIEARGTGLKTLNGWEESGLPSVEDYLEPGDEVDEEMVDYFLNVLPPRTMTGSLLQAGEPISDAQDENGHWRTTYLTFRREDDGWHYAGRCFPGSRTTNQQYRSSLERMIITRCRLINTEAAAKQEA